MLLNLIFLRNSSFIWRKGQAAITIHILRTIMNKEGWRKVDIKHVKLLHYFSVVPGINAWTK